MALVGVELETLVFEPDAQTTRPPPCVKFFNNSIMLESILPRTCMLYLHACFTFFLATLASTFFTL